MSLFSWLSSLFSKWIKIFKEFIEEIFPIAKQVIIAKLKEMAIKIITDLATKDLSSEEKRNEAFKAISEYAKTQGMEVSSSLINVIIELAYQKFKTERGE